MANKTLKSIALWAALLVLSGASFAEEAFVYDAAGKRDPFVPLIGVTTKGAESIADIVTIEDVTLQGIATNAAGQKVAIINDEMMKQGEIIGKVELRNISPQGIILVIDGAEYDISLYKEE